MHFFSSHQAVLRSARLHWTESHHSATAKFHIKDKGGAQVHESAKAQQNGHWLSQVARRLGARVPVLG
jgi:hypothetical protein